MSHPRHGRKNSIFTYQNSNFSALPKHFAQKKKHSKPPIVSYLKVFLCAAQRTHPALPMASKFTGADGEDIMKQLLCSELLPFTTEGNLYNKLCRNNLLPPHDQEQLKLGL
ncbi:hypothetical protein O181_076497 [Austropuccinia psidii MF-1]|uniref:Uncharacterized protein n=1 Tax=Austropuccinia psidii MF-1 TaxID=1389203 RepID=A0A9Q3FEE5_9BASI|nr:hypothetical protein [Austropuccinia psidii MF-1]